MRASLRRATRPGTRGAAAFLIVLCACGMPKPNQVVERYVAAANGHDIDAVSALLDDSVVWAFGADTFRGRDAALQPLYFDTGAETELLPSDLLLRGDSVDINLAETSGVLGALGIDTLHHRVRFVVTEGRIAQTFSLQPPREYAAFVDSITAFLQWLGVHDSASRDRFWPEGRFTYSQEAGAELPALIRRWRRRDGP